MKKNIDEIYAEILDFFNAPPTVNEKAWDATLTFYHELLTIMDEKNIKKGNLAKKMGKSKSAISKMLNGTPNISIKKMAELADAVGAEISISVKPVIPEENQELPVIIVPQIKGKNVSKVKRTQEKKVKVG